MLTHKIEPDGRYIEDSQWSDNYLGIGVFETMRLRKDSSDKFRILGFELHCMRFQAGLNILQIKTPGYDSLEHAVQKLVDGSKPDGDQVIRLVGTYSGISLNISPYEPHPWVNGVRLASVQMSRSVPELKSCSALVSRLAELESKEQHADTALLTEPDGSITECAWANFFWIDSSGNIFTTDQGVLRGITRTLLEQCLPVTFGKLNISQIVSGDIKSAFITQATSGIVPVLEIDGFKFSDKSVKLVQSSVNQAFERSIAAESLPITSFTL